MINHYNYMIDMCAFPFIILGIIFTILKVCSIINWGWVWILAPF